MKIAIFSTKSYDREFFENYNDPLQHTLSYFDTPLNKDTASLSQGHDAVCVFVNDEIGEETIAKLATNGIKVIGLRCAGFNNVNLKAAGQHQLKVVRVPAYSPHAVAEHAVAIILTLNRKTHKAFNRVRENNFSLERLLGFNLYGKTVGVIGTGEIGAVFCKIMLGFGCKLVAFDIKQSAHLKEAGVEYVPLEQLLQASDIISLHCPLTPGTRHFINADAFSKMKDGVMLINTGRGALINTQDAIEALKNKKLGWLGIDVYEQEATIFFKDLSESIIPDEVFARLMTFPNVLITGHQGFFTQEALEQITTTTLKNFSDFENGLPLENEVKEP